MTDPRPQSAAPSPFSPDVCEHAAVGPKATAIDVGALSDNALEAVSGGDYSLLQFWDELQEAASRILNRQNS